MFRLIQTTSLSLAVIAFLFVYPCGLSAQRGAGGGRTGGGLAGGGGLSGGSNAGAGLDAKDDLKDFHATLAVQATSQQLIQYGSILKSTTDAGAQLQGLQILLANDNNGKAELVARGGALRQTLEKIRSENKAFLEGFSEKQKSGLKEAVKKLTKSDSELEQQANAFDRQIDETKSAGTQRIGAPIIDAAQGLERVLAVFRTEELNLGTEMSIAAPDGRVNFTLNLSPVKSSLMFAGQAVSVMTSGTISKGTAQAGKNVFALELTADLSDLQQSFTEVLRAELDQSNQCGERVAVQSAVLTPLPPAGVASAKVHYERWACFGRDTNEIVEGDGTFEVKLTPAIGKDGAIELTPQTGRVEAEGLLGDLLRSGSLGEMLRNKIAEALLPVVRNDSNYKAMLPAAAQGDITVRSAHFEGTGLGKLSAVWMDEIQLSDQQASLLTEEGKTAPANTDEPKASSPRTDAEKTGTSQPLTTIQQTPPR